MKKTNPVCVYSEIGQIKEVIVHRPGPELGHFEPSDTNANLFDEIINWQQASKEHDKMVKIIKENGGKVIYYTDLIIDTYNKVDKEKKTIFKDKFVDEIVNISHDKKLDGKPIDSKIKKLVREYLDTLEVKDMVFKMIEGITTEMLGLEKRYGNYIVPAMPNLYFMRDTFSMVGNAINIHHMKYKVRDRESLFAWFVFNYNPRFVNTPKLINRDNKFSIEGGDIFPYNDETLVVGVSDRTKMQSILLLAKKLIKAKATFKHIVAINVPKEYGLMHLDTWLTMMDYKKFLYSQNIFSDIKFWNIDLTKKAVKAVLLKKGKIEDLIQSIIGKWPIMIPVAGNVSKMKVDQESKFDATNFFVIKPGVCVGYDRNYYTVTAMRENKLIVKTFSGDSLSLGMGSTRCMTMPISREKI